MAKVLIKTSEGDIKVYIGDSIHAAFAGKVRIVRYDRGGYGKYIVIRHNNGLETIYGSPFRDLIHIPCQTPARFPLHQKKPGRIYAQVFDRFTPQFIDILFPESSISIS